VAWSRDNLQRAGLSAAVTAAIAAQGPSDDLSWLAAVARAVAPLCGPLPAGPALHVGPGAGRLARPLGLPVVRSRAVQVPTGSACVRAADGEAARSWLARIRGGRTLHLVLGGDGWQRFLFDGPGVVSWTSASGVGHAVSIATELGLLLGYAGDRRGTVAQRATPIDVAVAIRTQLPRS
jgi:hypothetical protein